MSNEELGIDFNEVVIHKAQSVRYKVFRTNKEKKSNCKTIIPNYYNIKNIIIEHIDYILNKKLEKELDMYDKEFLQELINLTNILQGNVVLIKNMEEISISLPEFDKVFKIQITPEHKNKGVLGLLILIDIKPIFIPKIQYHITDVLHKERYKWYEVYKQKKLK